MARILNTGKIIVLGILAAGIIVFAIFFKDRIITSYAEKGLEKIFNEPVHITELKTSLLSSRISISTVQIGDTAVENIVIDLDAGALLKKRFIIENLRGSIIRRDSYTGGKTDKKETSGEKKDGGFDFSSVIPDAGALVSDHLKDFAAFREIDNTKILLKEKTDKLKEDTEELKKLSENLKDKTESLSKTRIKGIKDGTEALAEISGLIKEINSAVKKTAELKKEIDKGVSSARKAEKRIKDAAEEDYGTIDSLVSDPGGSVKDFASGYCRQILQEKTGKYYPLVKKGMDILNRIAADKNSSKKGEEAYRRKGRTVYFKVEKLPRFLLKKAYFTFGGDRIIIKISNVSSDPELLSSPTASFVLNYKSGSSSANTEGKVSFDGGKYSKLSFTVDINDFTISANEFSGRYSGTGTFVFNSRKELTGNSTIHLEEGSVSNPDGKEIIDDINKALADPGGYDISAVLFTNGKKTRIKVSTTLDDIVKNIIKQEAERTAETLRKRAKEEYKKQLDSKMKEIQPYLDDLDSIKSETEEISKEIRQYSRELRSTQSRIEKEMAGFSPSGLDKIKDAAGSLKLPF